MKILLLEDDYLLSRSIQTYLLKKGFLVDAYDNGRDVIDTIQDKMYDFYILDVNTPILGGLECLKIINDFYPSIPKIIISAYHDIDHISVAYDLGCSDYLKKPFNLKELEIKIEKLTITIPKPSGNTSVIILNNNHAYHKDTKQLSYNNKLYVLTPREASLIELFIDNIGQIVNEEMIQEHIWDNEIVEKSTIRSLVNRLRTKLHDDLIQNIRGFGYIIKKNISD